ncbi:pyrroline-5-carboxylate reductase [Anaerocellum diazotrophicum]|uniref:Pyrroline-5-carboxylate reductase n=1 Tax=Caldicellulosiruptor diazotrophicus TaxID=2806205 RepID=A0ABM7NM61_9FIRM|nr:pyrroline-5-carboxylate reductase [Caldicellulosiruptor diazotrophicus]BCS81207.1 pyrroline-5-carboxylate reductase [Caldicellulosiruptor diazotrophicus]
MKIGIIGCGNMASSIAHSIKQSIGAQLFCYDIDTDKANRFSQVYGAIRMNNEIETVESSSIIIIAVKPKDIFDVLEKIKDGISEKIIVSIVAGISISKIKEVIGDKKIVRVMPNINISVQKGVMGICFSEEVTNDEKEKIINLFKSMGEVIVTYEKYMDAITAIFGSGPAFVAHFIESFVDAAVKLGFPRQESLNLILTLFEGTVVNMKNNMLTTQQIKDMVTSPGGTTIEGLVEFERRAVKGAIIDGILKAFERSKNIL